MKGRTSSGKNIGSVVCRRLAAVAFALILTVIFAGVLGNGLAEAGSRGTESAEKKLYKSIQIEAGDTLWSIAEEYRESPYDSIYDSIDELMRINGLDSDQINAGEYLTVAYYDAAP